MIINNINTKKKVFIVAEIGNNHEGNFRIAKKMISEAASAGVDAVKFQTFIPEKFISIKDKLRFDKLKSFQLDYEQFKDLANFARDKGVIFFSTPLDLDSAKFLNSIQPIFKIASGDNNFYPMIDLISSFGKPIIISTGLADYENTNKIYRKILKSWKSRRKSVSNIAFLHCVSSYPVPKEQANLASIFYLKKKFPKIEIGYSDHTLGIDAAVLSVIAGARIIEKHFTLDKKYSNFRDHQLSSDPKEMRILVKKIREAERLLGEEHRNFQSCEKEMKISGRRSIAVARDIAPGHKLTLADLIWIRPGNGYPPGKEKEIIGKRVCRNLKFGDIINKKDIE